MIVEDTGNFCSRCDNIIDTDDMFEPCCNCISEVEEWTPNQFREEWDNLPSHIKNCFQPPKPLILTSIHQKGAISILYEDGQWGHYYPNVRSMPKGMFHNP